jgi:hypothetical protein
MAVNHVRAPAITAAPAKETPARERARGKTQQAAHAKTEAKPPTAAEVLTTTSGLGGGLWVVMGNSVQCDRGYNP